MKRGPARLVSNISVATRLSLIVLVVTLLSLVITAVVGLRRGNDLADGLNSDRLDTISASRVSEIEGFLRGVRREVGALSLSAGTADAIEQFSGAVDEMRPMPATRQQVDRLTEYYLTEVQPRLDEVRGTAGVGLTLPAQPVAIQLQDAYVVPREPDDEGAGSDAESPAAEPIDPALVDDAGDGSPYSEVHASQHPVYRKINSTSAFDDLYLIDARTETIVYSVDKGIDFASSLEVGPFSGGALADLIDTIAEDPVAGEARISDFARYTPAGDRPTAFVAAPVFDDDDDLVGYVAGAIPIEPVNDIMTSDENWNGFGTTGETYLGGTDAVIRSDPRPYLESPSTFLATAADVDQPSLTEPQLAAIDVLGTTVLVQPVNRRVIAAARDGAGQMSTTNYFGVDVQTVYDAIDGDDFQWVVFTEVADAELDGPIRDYARKMLFAVALFVVVITFIAARWSNGIMAPIRLASQRLRSVRSGRSDDADQYMPERSPQEYIDLAANIDAMLERLAERRDEVEARSTERLDLLREFLPASAVRRAESGDADAIDHVPSATVVVVVLQGLGELLARRSEGEHRQILGGIVDECDALATDFGLDRAKVTGDAYYAVCGVRRPYLDHAPRAVGFGLAVRDLVGELATQAGANVAAGVGVDQGMVAVGVLDQSGLVYDSWGPAVTGASQMARRAEGGEVLVSAAVRAQLPSHFVVESAHRGADDVAIVTARTDVAEGVT